jgi:hypothetical protein
MQITTGLMTVMTIVPIIQILDKKILIHLPVATIAVMLVSAKVTLIMIRTKTVPTQLSSKQISEEARSLDPAQM